MKKDINIEEFKKAYEDKSIPLEEVSKRFNNISKATIIKRAKLYKCKPRYVRNNWV